MTLAHVVFGEVIATQNKNLGHGFNYSEFNITLFGD